MDRLQDVAEVLVASWVLAASPGDRIPTSHGIMDEALERCLDDKSVFPDWFRNELHFVDSRVGLQCIELPLVLDWTQRLQLTTAPNPSYRYTQVQISERAARTILKTLGIPESDAREWGRRLREKIREAQRTLCEVPVPETED